jgi:hypothetical protein
MAVLLFRHLLLLLHPAVCMRSRHRSSSSSSSSLPQQQQQQQELKLPSSHPQEQIPQLGWLLL